MNMIKWIMHQGYVVMSKVKPDFHQHFVLAGRPEDEVCIAHDHCSCV